MCILVGDVLFSGDTLFRQSIGRTDFPGGNFDEIKASINNKLFTLPDETDVFPGHMGPTTIEFEKANNPFV
jgi:glyoxylase-like metal-dependent hydrolase (beta-lactamase superfamily II)